MEKMWTRDFSSEQGASNKYFMVLVRQTGTGGRYGVAPYRDIRNDETLVTDFEDGDVAIINRELRASVSDQRPDYLYFKVLARAKEYTDVQLEVPPKGDFWSKNSYRIQGGRAYVLRDMEFGPIFGLTVAIPSAIAGGLAMCCCNWLLTLGRRAT
jgi:hypothetical protein